MFIYRLGRDGLEPCLATGQNEETYLPADPTDLPWVAAAFAEEGHPLHAYRGVAIVPTREWPNNPSEMLAELGFVKLKRPELAGTPRLKQAIESAGLHVFDDWNRVFCLCHSGPERACQ
ncbi:MAG: hypothetical protein KC910_01695 [Candidatus Eremiobacteraeota bacterium]|nr:hypothetical protein [Candidatus Eremiobacteraeota bacterium]